ncbi:uncharacterized protein BXZ73DRAFT_73190 [Epithele typhae]|uniref:uncharacterized protein n=1 Tax=Epithele typhae TaxID=378194 RepID=UPI0020087025|nr:uncharacterized protein BXZ73DRAFT_73190 [Epithele typhae]KAH9944945.1 hypothetical protein BXZ73DRAFT_73190 [Epithele typhae]
MWFPRRRLRLALAGLAHAELASRRSHPQTALEHATGRSSTVSSARVRELEDELNVLKKQMAALMSASTVQVQRGATAPGEPAAAVPIPQSKSVFAPTVFSAGPTSRDNATSDLTKDPPPLGPSSRIDPSGPLGRALGLSTTHVSAPTATTAPPVHMPASVSNVFNMAAQAQATMGLAPGNNAPPEAPRVYPVRKPNNPTKYSGKADLVAFQRFAQEIHVYNRGYHIALEDQVFYASYYLTDRVYDFYLFNASADPGRWTMEDFLRSFFDHCFPDDFRQQKRNQIMKMYQGTRSVKEFVQELTSAYSVLNEDPPEAHARRLWAGLASHIQSGLWLRDLHMETATWDQIERAALAIERAGQNSRDARTHDREPHPQPPTGGQDKSHTQQPSRVSLIAPTERTQHENGQQQPRAFTRPTNGWSGTTPKNSGVLSVPQQQHKKPVQSHGGQRAGGSSNGKPLRPDSNSKPLGNSLSCYICGNPNHFQRNCPCASNVPSRSKGKPPGLQTFSVGIDFSDTEAKRGLAETTEQLGAIRLNAIELAIEDRGEERYSRDVGPSWATLQDGYRAGVRFWASLDTVYTLRSPTPEPSPTPSVVSSDDEDEEMPELQSASEDEEMSDNEDDKESSEDTYYSASSGELSESENERLSERDPPSAHHVYHPPSMEDADDDTGNDAEDEDDSYQRRLTVRPMPASHDVHGPFDKEDKVFRLAGEDSLEWEDDGGDLSGTVIAWTGEPERSIFGDGSRSSVEDPRVSYYSFFTIEKEFTPFHRLVLPSRPDRTGEHRRLGRVNWPGPTDVVPHCSTLGRFVSTALNRELPYPEDVRAVWLLEEGIPRTGSLPVLLRDARAMEQLVVAESTTLCIDVQISTIQTCSAPVGGVCALALESAVLLARLPIISHSGRVVRRGDVVHPWGIKFHAAINPLFDAGCARELLAQRLAQSVSTHRRDARESLVHPRMEAVVGVGVRRVVYLRVLLELLR